MKLNLFFVLIDLLVILAIPILFVWGILARLLNALVLQTSRRQRD